MFIEPVFGKKFFGREQVLATLHKRVTAMKGGYRQNIALTGPMLAGKSSILRHFLKSVKGPDVIPIYIELAGEDYDVFCTRYMATLLFEYLRSENLTAEGDFDGLIESCRSHIPSTVRHIEIITGLLSQKKEDQAYEKLLALTSIFKDETGKNCIVILDEFHNISHFKLKKPYQTFGKFIMIQKNTMYIVSSSQKTLLKEILSEKLSLLFGNFEVIEINGFDSQTAHSFMSDKAEIGSVSESIKNYLIQVSQGNPFYLEVLVNRLAKLISASDGKKGEKECLLDTFSELLYASSGVLNQYFTSSVNFFLEKKSRKKYLPILISIAHGNRTLKTIQKDMGRRDVELVSKLEKIQSMDLIYNSGIFYDISDNLFEYWLKFVYSLKTKSMIDDMDIKYLEFKNLVGRDYEAYSKFSKKSTTEIVSELFQSFDKEKIRVNMYDRKMPKFSSVETIDLGPNISEVSGRSGANAWVCRIKENDIADEQDITSLIDLKPRDKKGKIVRKIFIPLKRIEHNAFLLAKEKNIWIWDINQLNNILRLYGKFEVVL